MRIFNFLIISFLLIGLSCKSSKKVDDLTQIENNVRTYFFLSDSIDVDIVIEDTLRTPELEEMLEAVNKNLNLIDLDLDSLSSMIDQQAYAALHVEQELAEGALLRKNQLEDSLARTNLRLTEFQLKQAQLKAKRLSFKQTNRILLHLKRSVWADVAGFNITASYTFNDEAFKFELLLDALYTIVD